MTRARSAILVALAAVIAVTGSAEAATKKKVKKAAPKPVPVCKLVTDPAGDANGINPGSPVPATSAGTSDDALDITSVDVAANAQTITGVLRIKKLSATDSNAPTGINWSVNFTINKTTFTLAAHAAYDGTISYDASYLTAAGGSLYPGNLTGTFDKAKNEIHISVPTSTLAAQEAAPLGTKITGISGVTGPEILVPEATGKFGGGTFLSDVPNTVDATSPGKDYTTGVTSCVTPGK